MPTELLRNERFRQAIGVNQHAGVEWFNKERFERAVAALPIAPARRQRLKAAGDRSGYRLDLLAVELAATSRSVARAKPRNETKPRAKTKPAAKAKK